MKAQKTYFGDEIDRILLKDKHKRTKQDNQKLLFEFQSFPFFLEMMNKYTFLGNLMIETIIKSLSFFELPKGTPLFRQGELISRMYIICQGQVNLYKQPLSIKLRPPDSRSKGYEKFKAIFKKYLIYSVDKDLDYMYGEGQAIGEKDILSGKKRLSLCEANTNCIIAELTSTDYLSIFERTDCLEKNSIYTLLSSLPFFIKCKNSLTERVQDVLVKKRFSKGQMLYKQGDPFDSFYIIRKGTFQVSIKSTIKFLSIIDTYCFFELYKDLYERFSCNRVFELKNEYEEIWEYKLLNLGSGEFLGNFEYKLNTGSYLFSALCLSDNSEVFEISKNVFESILTPFCKQILLDEAEKEMKYFQQRVKDIKDIKRQRDKGNKYKAALLTKIRMKEDQLERQLTQGNDRQYTLKELRSISPIKAINNTRIMSSKFNMKLFVNKHKTSKHFNRNSTINNNNCNMKNNELMHEYTMQPNANSFATCDSNKRLRKENNNGNGNTKAYATANAYCDDDIKAKNLVPLHYTKTSLPTNFMIKKALKLRANDFYRPQTSTINNYKDLKLKRPETSATQESSDTLSSRFRLFSESNKKLYPKCLEINKEFALNNNTNINAHKMYQLFCYKKK